MIYHVFIHFYLITSIIFELSLSRSWLTKTLMNIMSCVPFLLPQSYDVSCYKHVMLKYCQYVNINELKMCGDMTEVSIKKFNLFSKRQSFEQNKSVKRRQEWIRGLVEMHFLPLQAKLDSYQNLVYIQSHYSKKLWSSKVS